MTIYYYYYYFNDHIKANILMTFLSKYFNFNVIKIFALKNLKINIHQNVSRAFNILHYSKKEW